MFIDKENEYSDAQALTASAASTNVINHGAAGDLGGGEPMGILISCDVALAGTSPTLDIKLEKDTVEAFSSAEEVISIPQISSMAAGDKKVIPVPPMVADQQYSRVYYTLGGTSPTVTLTAQLLPLESIQNFKAYADAI